MEATPIKPEEKYDVTFWDGKAHDPEIKEGSPEVVPTTPGSNELPRGIVVGYVGSILEGDGNTVHPGDAIVKLFVSGQLAAVVGLERQRALTLFGFEELSEDEVEDEDSGLPKLPASSLTNKEDE
jgi:hypothetical protein